MLHGARAARPEEGAEKIDFWSTSRSLSIEICTLIGPLNKFG